MRHLSRAAFVAALVAIAMLATMPASNADPVTLSLSSHIDYDATIIVRDGTGKDVAKFPLRRHGIVESTLDGNFTVTCVVDVNGKATPAMSDGVSLSNRRVLKRALEIDKFGRYYFL